MSNRTRQNNKGEDRKTESNDNPEIPVRGGEEGGHQKSPASLRANRKLLLTDQHDWQKNSRWFLHGVLLAYEGGVFSA